LSAPAAARAAPSPRRVSKLDASVDRDPLSQSRRVIGCPSDNRRDIPPQYG
jgi:hypothetical protein